MQVQKLSPLLEDVSATYPSTATPPRRHCRDRDINIKAEACRNTNRFKQASEQEVNSGSSEKTQSSQTRT